MWLRRLTAVFLLIAAVAASTDKAASPTRCVPNSHDRDGYLVQACRYIKEHHVEVSADPNTWTIRRITKQVVAGRRRTVVHYSCCYLGDIAYFDDEGRLVDFIPGAK
jgi:hypothetical protein